MVSPKAADAYTTFELVLEPQDCERHIGSFTISLTPEPTDSAHFAAFSNEHAVQGYGPINLVSAQVTADAPLFTDDEIAIYRDFLLHYPDQPSEMIGMQATTVAFVASIAFGPEPDPPTLEIPTYSERKLPPEVMALTDEKAVTERMAAEGKLSDASVKWHFTLSDIAFDSKHERAAFVYSALCGCKGSRRGTVVYELKNGQWMRKGPILNFWIG